MRFLAGLAALLLFASAPAAAQRPPAVITGRVMILDSVRAGAGVLVTIESVILRKSTDSTGHYRLVVPSKRFGDGDSVTMIVSRAGLRPDFRRIRLTAGASIRADFGLKVQGHPIVCDNVFSDPRAGLRPSALDSKLCRLPHILRRKLPGHPPCPTVTCHSVWRRPVARRETLGQARASVNLNPFRTSSAGDSQLRRFIFYAYIALPGVEAAYREATATRAPGG
ncbi:MAG TPA: hypothetical protein VEQ60_27195 [Longimicrobium sp.]|nr:hypothetical protein [Longimicrobium sp.]